MNLLAKRLLTYAAPTIAGAVAGAGGTVALTGGAHEAISMALGDTIQPRFSVRTDTVLKVVGNRIAAVKCGNSAIFLRTFLGASQLTADTISVNVPCVNPLDTAKVSTVEVCFWPADSAAKYGVDASRSLSPLQDSIVRNSPWGKCGKPDTLYLDSVLTVPLRRA